YAHLASAGDRRRRDCADRARARERLDPDQRPLDRGWRRRGTVDRGADRVDAQLDVQAEHREQQRARPGGAGPRVLRRARLLARGEGMTRSAVAAAASGEFQVMGIVNVTPDSFSDGGLYLDASAAIEHGLELERSGATILDVGGESTRPGANPVREEEELRRVVPVIEGLVSSGVRAQTSIDTSKSAVAAAAIACGATLVNDVTALRGDPTMVDVVAAAGADCCLMHMLGEPRTMQRNPHYDDVVSEVKAFLVERMEFAVSH